MKSISQSFARAQCNLQLFDQLIELGYAESDLAKIASCYDVALRLLTAQYRQNGRSFLTHHVATASVLAAHGAAASTISAGLLHSAYARGDFGTQRFGITRSKRSNLDEAVGAEVEGLIASYTAIRWRLSTIPSLIARLDTMSAQEREVMFMRVANEIDESWEFAFSTKEKRDETLDQLLLCVELTRKLGKPELTREVEEAHLRLRSRAVPPDYLFAPHGRRGVFVSPPASYGLRLRARAAMAARRVLHSLPVALRLWTGGIRHRRAYGRPKPAHH